jgi:tetratricopeptide (TPR) repeat protein
LSKAIPLLERALRATETKLGPDHPDTIESRNNLAMAYQAGNQLSVALPLFEQAAAGLQKLRFQDQNALTILNNTISAYEAAKKWDRAEVWRRQLTALARQQVGETSAAYANQLASLGNNLIRQKKWAEAESILRDALAVYTRAGQDLWVRFRIQSQLGSSLLGQQKYAEAEPILLAGHAGLKQRQKSIPATAQSCLAESAGYLVQLYEATGNKVAAEQWRKILTGLQAAPKASEKR